MKQLYHRIPAFDFLNTRLLSCWNDWDLQIPILSISVSNLANNGRRMRFETLNYPPNDETVPNTLPPATTIDASELRRPLASEVSAGFDFMTLQRFIDVGLDSICMWDRDGNGLEFYSRFVELPYEGAYHGAGVLCVGYAEPHPRSIRRIALPADFSSPIQVLVLSVVVHGVNFESGLILKSRIGSHITMVSGAFPFTIEISASFNDNVAQLSHRRGGHFQPERRLTEYSQEPLREK
jgi:hypothetical protein